MHPDTCHQLFNFSRETACIGLSNSATGHQGVWCSFVWGTVSLPIQYTVNHLIYIIIWSLLKTCKNQGKQRKTEDWYFSLPWSYSLLELSLHTIIMLNFLQTFKTVKLALSLTV
jgi:hypothetical protein